MQQKSLCFPSKGTTLIHFASVVLIQAWNLGRVRHPNLVTLIGTCPESRSLIYEYLEKGSLEDHLVRNGKTPPLTWQTRTKIASEICSVLIFLHSSRPSIVHGNVKPKSILLDANFVSKLSDLWVYRFAPQNVNPTDLESSVYVDPDFLETGELTAESDVYSFGIVLLQLLTGRPALGMVKDVKCALERGNFNALLDLGAGEWPLEEAKTLAHLALRCCVDKRDDRPDLVSQVWSVIELMKESCTSKLDSKGPGRIPSHFVCPIFQVIIVHNMNALVFFMLYRHHFFPYHQLQTAACLTRNLRIHVLYDDCALTPFLRGRLWQCNCRRR